MNVYWGYAATGKTCLEYQHLYGGKSFSWIGKFCARTRSGTVHLTGLQNNKKWWDLDVTNTIWHKRKDEDKVRTVSNSQRKLCYILGGIGRSFNMRYMQVFPMNYIDPDLDAEPKKREQNTLRLNTKGLKKYSHLKYVNSQAYFSAMNNQTGKCPTGILEPMIPKYYPTDAHTICPFELIGRLGDNEPLDEWFQDQRIILPFKSDLYEYAITFLDSLGDFRIGNKWGIDVIQAFKDDQKYIYDYLDYSIFTVPKIHAERFKKYNINFEYFDLDKGDYKKTFDLSRSLSRNLDNQVIHQLRNTKKKKESRERYFRLYDIADKYLKSRGRKDNRV